MAHARALLALLAFACAGCDEGPVVASAGSSGPRVDPGADDPVDFGALPDFRLTSEHGADVTLADLRGRPLVFAALFTTCVGPCPSIARGLLQLQRDLADTDALLVVVSVDPEVDRPEVLARYAERIGADPERWIFLTGPRDEVERFVQQGLHLSVAWGGEAAAPGERVTHDVRLLAVDRAGRRRGWYTGTEGSQLERLRRRMRHLASEAR